VISLKHATCYNKFIPLTAPLIATLNITPSSIHALLFDSEARALEGYGSRVPYRLQTTPDGGLEIDPEQLSNLALDCIDDLHRQVHFDNLKIAAVCGASFPHSLLGAGQDRSTLPILHPLDRRAQSELPRISSDHARTGCSADAKFWPAKILWFAQNRRSEFAATRFLLSFPEFLFLRLFGCAHASTSIVSATGLWDQNAADYDDDLLAHLQVDRRMLARPENLDQPARGLAPEYAQAWPRFDQIPWFPFIADVTAEPLGCGALGDRFLLTASGMRAAIAAPRHEIRDETWCHRLDCRRFVLGAESNGADVYAWAKRTFALPKDLESRLDSTPPGGHGLIMRPGAITGLTTSTDPFDLFRAALESVARRSREIQNLLGSPATVIASGGAILHSPAWTQMMADALGCPVIASTEREPAARGAALWALEQLGESADLPASTGATFEPRADYAKIYES
jgi:gluconokinase